MKTATMRMLHADNPAEGLKNSVGDISNIKVLHNNILCAVYKRPAKTASGIHLPDQILKEDEYQGKVVLVLKKGPLAFVDDEKTAFAGQDINEGEWVVLRSSDGWKLNVNGVLCQIIQDVQVRLTIPSPDLVY